MGNANGATPESWSDPAKINAEVHFTTTVGRCLVLHGNLVVACRHPGNTGWARTVAEEMIDTLESIFRDVGLEEPSQGWRGDT